jgi:tRNA A-37 threonylcarbamoyl transferase component Bud32
VSNTLHERARKVFLAAIEHSPADRPSIVREQCQGDVALEAEVQSLLAYHQEQTLLAETSKHSSAATTTVLPEQSKANTKAKKAKQHREPSWFGTEIGRLATTAVLAAIVAALLGLWAHGALRAWLRQMLHDNLTTLVAADARLVDQWIDQHIGQVQSWGREPTVREQAQRLMEVDAISAGAAERLITSPAQAELRESLDALSGAGLHCAVWNRAGICISDWSLEGHGIGAGLSPLGGKLFAQVMAGTSLCRVVDPQMPITLGYPPTEGGPSIAILTPLRDEQGTILGMLGAFMTENDPRLSEVFQLSHTGETGEMLAFDRQGRMLSQSRLAPQLLALGLIDPPDGDRTALRVQLRDPGVDLTRGYKAALPIAARPLTHMAALAVSGHDGSDIDGYRDMRGVPVVGAWQWLEDHELGLAAEIDYAEAYRPLRYLSTAVWGGVGLMLVGVGAVSALSYRLQQLQRRVDRVGQYTLTAKIGEGGMGEVYLARHALLKRPVAIKLLKSDQDSAESVARFEREVQLAAQLNNPHTVEIYDFGRSSSGRFYYVMEYLDGLSLAQLVMLDGPLPQGRVAALLDQVCQSLAEAHSLGMVHRDIKPQNLLVCRRGGQADVIKVVDFGLVKTNSPDDVTATVAIMGTPLYMAPERFRDPATTDPRCDLYSVGAVAYFLLTGRNALEFEGKNPWQVLLDEAPANPSVWARETLDPEFESLVMRLLAKDPADRPASANAVIAELDQIARHWPWSQADAERWWELNSTRVAFVTRPQAIESARLKQASGG